MKTKNIFHLFVGAALLGALFSCKKEENPYADDVTPVVSLTTPDTAFDADQATVRLTLDHFIHSDVTVILKAEANGEDITPAVTPNEYTVEAGAVKKDITLTLNEELAPIGNYPVTITLQEVTGANVSSSANTVSLGMVNKDETVLAITFENFTDNEGSITFTLGKTLTTDATITLATSDDTEIPDTDLTYDKTVVIAAGARFAKIPVTVNPENLDFGISDAVIELKSMDNRLSTKVSDVHLQARVDLILEEHSDWRFGVSGGSLYAYQHHIDDPKLYYTLIPVSDVADNLEAKVQEAIMDVFSKIKAGDITPFDWEGASEYQGSVYKYFGTVSSDKPFERYYMILFTLNENGKATGRYGVKNYTSPAQEAEDYWWMLYYYSSYKYLYNYVYSAASTGYYYIDGNVSESTVASAESISSYIKDIEAKVQAGELDLISSTGYVTTNAVGYSLVSGTTYYGIMVEFTEDKVATGYYFTSTYSHP